MSGTASAPDGEGVPADSPPPPPPPRPLVLTPLDTPPTFRADSPALCWQLHAVCGLARAGTLHLKHSAVRTPVFMPVGTKAAIKGLLPRQLLSEKSLPGMTPEIILANTYHCALQPGTEVLKQVGGVHNFMGWPRSMLTDSGGFQMVSLLDLADVTEEGVTFLSPADGSSMLLTPEESIRHQNCIGADIIMQLDDVVSTVQPDHDRFAEAVDRSVRWLDRCIAAHARPDEQSLFAIVQGGLDVSPGGLRSRCLEAMVRRELPGYAIGGLAGGEDKNLFWRVVAHGAAALPADKPRYVMGIGYPLDLVVCSALGCDMYDCVFPTRTARFGTALLPQGQIKLKNKEFATDSRPIQKDCECVTCQHYTRAQLHRMLKTVTLGGQLITLHNVAYLMSLMRTMRQSILEGTFGAFVQRFLDDMFPSGDVPAWAVDAFQHADVPVRFAPGKASTAQADTQGVQRGGVSPAAAGAATVDDGETAAAAVGGTATLPVRQAEGDGAAPHVREPL